MNEIPTLVKDLHDFEPGFFGDPMDVVRADTDERDTLFVACSDHGWAPDNTSFAKPGRLYIVQNLATSIPGSTSREQSLLGSLQYAVCLENVEHAVVCGHLGCKVVQQWMKSGVTKVQDVEVSDFERVARPRVEEAYAAAASQRTRLMIVEHTLFQLENLQSHDFIRARLEVGRLRLHAWIVDDETARVHVYDARTGQFTRL